MKIINNEVQSFSMCLCTKHDYSIDLERVKNIISLDNKSLFASIEYLHIEDAIPYIQFPYTKKEYIESSRDQYRCKKCGRIPYRMNVIRRRHD